MSSHPEFVLKHRLVGAGVLIFFGVLVVPWLLGPSGSSNTSVQEQNGAANEIQDQRPDEQVANPSEDDVISAMVAERLQDTAQEETYISRITPADQGSENSDTTAQVDTQTDTESNTQPSDTEANNSRPQSTNQSQAAANATPPTVANQQPAPAATNQAISNSNSNTIEVGWAVQVGVFIDAAGAERVVIDLREKGFAPKTTIVDTNKGPKTGTRVWLGPFATRVDAAKGKAQLTEKTGERGFIRSYP